MKLAVVGGLAYAWVASDVRTFTKPAEVLTGVPIAIVAITLLTSRRGTRSADDTHPARWLAAWGALALTLVTWELFELFSSPRHEHPTMSSIGDAILRSSRFVHATAFATWLAMGAALVVLARRERTS